MTEHRNVVIKLGGSLMDCAASLIRQIDEQARRDGWSVLIVPGGAVFADNVRRFQQTSGISEDAAHWMAVLAMEQYAHYLAERSGAQLTGTLDMQGTGVNILLPYNILRGDDSGLEHSWDVTSDTISAWVAWNINGRLVKATDVDGVYMDGGLVPEIYAGDMVYGEETCVDRGLPAFLVEHEMDCLVVNGRYPQRVLEVLEGDETLGTLIYGKSKF